MKKLLIIILVFLSSAACHNSSKKTTRTESVTVKNQISTPEFNADTAYYYVTQQTKFGPRVPGSDAHKACADWLVQTMSRSADTVIVQSFRTRIYNKQAMDGKNIISVFNPEAKKRVLLAAHWDSRPFADHDDDQANHRIPIDGANDGASGVGVLMEVARLLKLYPLDASFGVDILFFDLEDYGPPNGEREYFDEDGWALGSQYWAKTPHMYGYTARFGILLDMVGASQAIFPREYYSQQYAGWVLDKVWRKAATLGYDHAFVNKPGSPINDDHIPINRTAGIPTINIIHLDPNSKNQTFFDHWHTINDNLDKINSETLKMVGQLVTTIIYEES